MPTAQEAVAHVASQNSRKRTPVPATLLRQDIPPLYIFNVWEQAHVRNLGGLGRWEVKGCPEGQEFSEALEVPGVKYEDYDEADGHGKMNLNFIDGNDLVDAIIGTKSSVRNLDPMTTNWEHLGVFVSATNPPQKAEVEAAKKKLTEFMLMLVRTGDQLALQGDKGVAQIGEMLRKAVKYTNQSREWAKLPEKLIDCPGCQLPIRPGTVMHGGQGGCGAILDEAKARILFPQLYAQATEEVEPVAPKKGKNAN